jgi:hypothetical protein
VYSEINMCAGGGIRVLCVMNKYRNDCVSACVVCVCRLWSGEQLYRCGLWSNGVGGGE